ncbi:hypothetical protein, variant 2 [Aphanomyces invadans]|uniref:EGF-like domain-containing protein n=1 Tax=Aphanomyces invadans TaxID=157072 RepID=A0A024TG85_9STRA|nr:hypothetical protein, variant 2 [Aphanomyces invadans]ETV93053.1 hypothetical protein, variant 2 [Aphanomyces invadans]|eukprot:XP_008878320.1 hypothetical protein, variant 2 [Aphanomyces invadans]
MSVSWKKVTRCVFSPGETPAGSVAGRWDAIFLLLQYSIVFAMARLVRPITTIGACWSFVALVTMLVATTITAAPADKKWITHFYGRVKADSYEYFVVDVPRGVFAVDVSLLLSDLGARVPPTLFLQKDRFATETSFEMAFNTSHQQPYVMASLTNLEHGRYYAMVWGGNVHGSVNNFGVGPSTNMWWYLDFTFRSCHVVDMLGSSCATAPVPLPRRRIHSPQQQATGSSDGRGCVDTVSNPSLFSFELVQPAAYLDVTLDVDDPSNVVVWGLYLNAANPMASDAVQNATSATRTLRVMRPLVGRWIVGVALQRHSAAVGKCNDDLSENTGGIPLTVTWSTTEECDSFENELCPASWTPLNQLRDAANPVDDYIVDAAFSASQPSKPNMTHTALVAYDVQVDPMYAGTSVVVHLATTAHVANFSVFIRVDGWPTASLFDYSFDASQGRPIGTLGSATDPIDPSVQSFEALRQQPNSTTMTAPSFLEFPPIVFPKIGHWYIIVAPTVPSTPSQREWGVAIQLQTNACPPRNVCSNHGTCLVKTSYQGIVYGECQCAYGYGGRDCSSLVYTPRERSGRTWLLLLSNAAILPAAILSWMRRLYGTTSIGWPTRMPSPWGVRRVVEAVLFVALGVISGVYHACDLNLYCMFPYAFLQSMDFTFTFNAIMLGFIHLSGAFKHAKAGMQVFVLVALVFMTTYNATSMKNWIVLGGVITVQFVATWSYYVRNNAASPSPDDMGSVVVDDGQTPPAFDHVPDVEAVCVVQRQL